MKVKAVIGETFKKIFWKCNRRPPNIGGHEYTEKQGMKN